jgi:predicted type IV restriction endonuclease
MAFDFDSFVDRVAQVIGRVADTTGALSTLNETETRALLIDPLLVALGYESLGQMRREFRLSASGQIVDYLLRAGNRQVVVEAKAATSDLTPRDASQLVGYCAQEGIRWALLTNGTHWQVFDIEVPGNWESKRVSDIDLLTAYRNERLVQDTEPLAHFALETLQTDEAPLRGWAHRERVRHQLQQLVTDPNSSVIRAVIDSMMSKGISVEAEDVVTLLRTQSPTPTPPTGIAEPRVRYTAPPPVTDAWHQFYLFPVASGEPGTTPIEHLRLWLEAGFWGVGALTVHRQHLSPGDRCCFYATRVGVVAHARIIGQANQVAGPEDWPGPGPWHPDVYKVPLAEIQWLQSPIAIDATLRARIETFEGRDLAKPWGWFVQTTGVISERDFRLLTGWPGR